MIAYLAISLPVVGVGVLADLAGLRPAGLTFAAIVATLALTVLVLLTRGRGSADARPGRAPSAGLA